jgi:hypothetical protein
MSFEKVESEASDIEISNPVTKNETLKPVEKLRKLLLESDKKSKDEIRIEKQVENLVKYWKPTILKELVKEATNGYRVSIVRTSSFWNSIPNQLLSQFKLRLQEEPEFHQIDILIDKADHSYYLGFTFYIDGENIDDCESSDPIFVEKLRKLVRAYNQRQTDLYLYWKPKILKMLEKEAINGSAILEFNLSGWFYDIIPSRFRYSLYSQLTADPDFHGINIHTTWDKITFMF